MLSSMLNGFKEFILRGNVVDLAIGVVIGAAFNSVVSAMVKDLITPLISLFGGIPDFDNWVIRINRSEFLIGDFLSALLTFLINAAVIYFLVVLPLNRFFLNKQKEETNAVKKENKTCPYCLSEIPKKATKCAFCTSPLKQ